jgi:tripartite-type tricarboxylate transporter receptor subunit TctC
LNAVIVTALKDSKLRDRLQNEGASPIGSTPAEFAVFVRDDIKGWAPVVKWSGATPN